MTPSRVARNAVDRSPAKPNDSDRLLATWRQLVAVITDRELTTITALCTIALLIALNLILRFPDLGALIEQYNQF
jgi:hypothetical protein